MLHRVIALSICVIILVGCSQGISSFTPQPQPTVPSSSPTVHLPSRTSAPTSSPIPSPTIQPSPTSVVYPEPPLMNLIDTFPASCPSAGSQSYQEDIPQEVTQLKNLSINPILERKNLIVVKNNSDEINGDTSSLAALIANPGNDGISLREALQVSSTISDGVSIRFDPSLLGAVINVGSWNHSELPPLSGGSVTLSGDVDGDGKADVTLNDAISTDQQNRSAFGIRVHSSDNVLYALKTIGFSNPVFLDAPSKNQVYSGNVITQMLFEDGNGIGLYSGHGNDPEPIEENHNTWKDTWIINNTFHSKGGIAIGLERSSMDRIENLVIKDNQIEIISGDPTNVYEGINLTSGGGMTSTGNVIENVTIMNNKVVGNPYVAFGMLVGYNSLAGGNTIRNVYLAGNSLTLSDPNSTITQGIQISTGFWVNQTGNTISDIVMIDNTIEGYHDNSLVTISSGTVGSSGNIIERIRISHNHFIILHPVLPSGAPITALSLMTGDAATDYLDPNYQPIIYPDNNVLRDVWITSNVFTGQGGPAISIGTGDPGSQHNELSNIYILGNDIDGFFPGSGFNNAAIILYLGGKGDDRIQQVYIQQNTIHQINQRTGFNGEEIVSGGIVMTAGNGTQNSYIKDVTVIGNEIDSPVPGINVIGGFSRGEMKPTTGNTISQIRLWCNVIDKAPTMLLTYYPDIKGINLAGGYGPTNGNLVTDIDIHNNYVAGEQDDISIYDNVGKSSSDNLVEYQGN